MADDRADSRLQISQQIYFRRSVDLSKVSEDSMMSSPDEKYLIGKKLPEFQFQIQAGSPYFMSVPVPPKWAVVSDGGTSKNRDTILESSEAENDEGGDVLEKLEKFNLMPEEKQQLTRVEPLSDDYLTLPDEVSVIAVGPPGSLFQSEGGSDTNFFEKLQLLNRILKTPTRTRVKGPLTDERRKLPPSLTVRHTPVAVFTKAIGASQGFIRVLGHASSTRVIDLSILADYRVVHVRKDGWVLFHREGEVSLHNVILEKSLQLAPINFIGDPKVLSGTVFGDPSGGKFEVNLMAVGRLLQFSCSWLHLPRGQTTWVIRTFTFEIPTFSVGPLLLEGVAVFLLDGSVLLTVDQEFSVVRSRLNGFQVMNGCCSLVEGREGKVYAVQVSENGEALSVPRVLILNQGLNGWGTPVVAMSQEVVRCGWFLNGGDIGFKVEGIPGYHLNQSRGYHLNYWFEEVWAGYQEHPGCTCEGGFLALY